jgi:hypothetical protein
MFDARTVVTLGGWFSLIGLIAVVGCAAALSWKHVVARFRRLAAGATDRVLLRGTIAADAAQLFTLFAIAITLWAGGSLAHRVASIFNLRDLAGTSAERHMPYASRRVDSHLIEPDAAEASTPSQVG